jgi:hypothetical protein
MAQRSVVGGVLLLLMGLSAAVIGQPSDAFVGTWKYNPAKSTYSPGPPPKSNTITVEPVADGAMKITFDGVNAQGQPTHSERVTKFDGKEVPLQAVQPPTTAVTTMTYKRIDDHAFEVVSTVDTITTRVVVSRDGKTQTATQTGTNAQGQTVKNVIVSEKQ